MISEELSIPEPVADFIEGRIPKRVGARQYTKLLRQAEQLLTEICGYLDKITVLAVRHSCFILNSSRIEFTEL
jgi:intergrase/recombinase